MKKYLLPLVLLLAPLGAWAAPSCTTAVIGTGGSTTISTTSGDIVLLVSMTSGGAGSPYVTAISGAGSTWNTSVLGTFGTSSSYILKGTLYMSAFYAYAASTGSTTITPTYNGGTPSTAIVFAADCTAVASSSPLASNIYNYQTSVANTANAVTVAGGTGSDSVTSGNLIVGFFRQSSSTLTAGTSPIAFTSQVSGANGLIEWGLANTTGTFDATATNGNSNTNENSWQLEIKARAGGAPCPCQGFLGLQ